jgi:hypothetical protein
MCTGYIYTLRIIVSSINLHVQDINTRDLAAGTRRCHGSDDVPTPNRLTRAPNISSKRRIDWRSAPYMIRDVLHMFSNVLLFYGVDGAIVGTLSRQERADRDHRVLLGRYTRVL